MTSCTICFDALKTPVSLPCTHSFCTLCISKVIQSVKPFTIHQWCPTCKAPYTIVRPDPSIVPPSARPQAPLPQRKTLLRHDSHTHTTAESASECTRIREENLALKVHGNLWRRRAEAHASATVGLLNLARMARDQALQMKLERDELHKQYMSLKRKLEESDLDSCPLRSPPILEEPRLPVLPPSPATTAASLPARADVSDGDATSNPGKRRRTLSDSKSGPRRSLRLVGKPLAA